MSGKTSKSSTNVTEVRYCDGINLDHPNDATLHLLLTIRSVIVDSPVQNPTTFVQLIEACRNLKFLSAKNASLSQQVYDELPTRCEHLESLEVVEDYELNCEFALHFKCLSFLSLNQHVSFDLLLCAFSNNASLKTFCFRYRRGYGSIDILERDEQDSSIDIRDEQNGSATNGPVRKPFVPMRLSLLGCRCNFNDINEMFNFMHTILDF